MQKIKTFLLQVLGIVYIIFLAFSAYFAITSLNVIFEFAHIDVSISSMLFKEKSLSYMFWSYQIEDGFLVYVLLRGVLNPLMIFAGFQTIAYLVTLLIKFLCRFIKNEKNKKSGYIASKVYKALLMVIPCIVFIISYVGALLMFTKGGSNKELLLFKDPSFGKILSGIFSHLLIIAIAALITGFLTSIMLVKGIFKDEEKQSNVFSTIIVSLFFGLLVIGVLDFLLQWNSEILYGIILAIIAVVVLGSVKGGGYSSGSSSSKTGYVVKDAAGTRSLTQDVSNSNIWYDSSGNKYNIDPISGNWYKIN